MESYSHAIYTSISLCEWSQ